MATARVSRRIAAAPAAVWNVAADPLSLPQWWPRVVRVEGVSSRAFTEVLQTQRGKQVRADYRVTDQDHGRRRVWSQEIDGTPFERHFTSLVVELRVQPVSEAETTVTLEQRVRLRGASRLGGFLAARAARRTLREALAGLEEELTR